jgi:uncharacterized membrane protein
MRVLLGCHGIPERCLTFGNYRMSFCARCLGGTIGHSISFLAVAYQLAPTIFISVLLVLPMAVDGGLQMYNSDRFQSTSFRRLTTGFLGGYGFGTIIWTVFLKAMLFATSI